MFKLFGKILLVMGAVTLLSSCGLIPAAPAKLLKIDDGIHGVTVVDFPAERRGGWVVPQKDGSVRVCAEPPTDVGINVNQLMNLVAQLKKGDIGGEGSLDYSLDSTIVELKGRTPAVLALRDVMYRMCEARIASNGLTTDEIKIYQGIVSVIENFAKAELTAAQEKQERTSRQKSGDVGLAKQKETEAFQALAKKEWANAQKLFEESEGAFNTYGWSYEYAQALKVGGTDKQQAQRILNIKGRLPLATKEVLEAAAK